MFKNNTKNYLKAIVFLIVVYIAVFLTLNILRYYSFFSFEWQDEATNNQIAWNTAHGRLFYQSIFNGRFHGHFNLILFLIALGYAIFPHIFTWHFLLIASVALAGIIIYKLAFMQFRDCPKAFLITLLYLLYPPLHYLHLGKINPTTFFMPLIIVSFYFFQKNKFIHFLIFIILSLACVESISLFVIMFSIYAAICRKSKRWVFVPLFLGIGWFIIATWFVIPYTSNVNFNLDTENHIFHSLDRHTFSGLIRFIVFKPGECLAFMFSKEHLLLLMRLFLPVCFVPAFSLVLLIGIPGFLQLLFMKGPLLNEGSYYISGAIPFIMLGYVYGLARLDRILTKFRVKGAVRNRIIYFIIFCSIFISISISLGNNIYGTVNKDAQIYDTRFSNVKNIFDPVFYKMDGGDKLAWSLIRQIPKAASVSASGDLLIPLSHRKRLLEFGNKEVGYDYFNAEYIILNRRNMYHGAGHYSEITEEDLGQLYSLVENGKFKILSEKGGFILLKKNNQ